MRIIDCIQGGEEWYLVRLGKVTASRFSDVLAKGRGDSDSKSRLTYLKQLRAERLTGIPEELFHNKAMQDGQDREAEARQVYANESGNEIIPVGFVELNEDVGCSPDGLVGEDGLVEIKCPYSRTHIDYIEADEVPTVYYAQMQGCLWITGRQWCDFVSYDPRVSCRPYFVKRTMRDNTYIASLEFCVNKFIKELNEMILNITNEKEF